MTTTISRSSSWISPAFNAAYGGEVPVESFVANPAGDGAILTATFAQPGEVASYAQLRNGVRYGWPAMFALGWLGGYLAWVAIGKKQAKKKMSGRISGLAGTPEEHLAKFREYLGKARRTSDLRQRMGYVERAWAEAEWTSVPSSEAKSLLMIQKTIDP